MRRVLVGLALVTTLTGLTACGGGDAKPEAAATSAAPAPADTPTSSPTPKPEPTATVQQYASVVAQTDHGVLKYLRQWPDCDPRVNGSMDFACGLLPLGTGWSADTVAVSLQTAMKKGRPDYIGQPPAEISKLVQQTIDDGKALYRVSTRSSKRLECLHTLAGGCASLWFDFDMAVRNMQNTLQGWQPYL